MSSCTLLPFHSDRIWNASYFCGQIFFPASYLSMSWILSKILFTAKIPSQLNFGVQSGYFAERIRPVLLHRASVPLVERWVGRSTTVRNDKELKLCVCSRVFDSTSSQLLYLDFFTSLHPPSVLRAKAASFHLLCNLVYVKTVSTTEFFHGRTRMIIYFTSN